MTSEEKVEALERRIAELEAVQRKPAPTSAPLSTPSHSALGRASLPRSVVRDMAAAVSDKEMREIVRAGGIGEPTTLAGKSSAPAPSQSQGSRNGWAPEMPLTPPPGVATIDRLLDAEDAKEKAARRISAALAGSAKPMAKSGGER